MQETVTQTSQLSDAPDSPLDRRVNLTAIPINWLAWAAVFIVSTTIRLVGRTNSPLSPGESAIARDAWSLIHGNDLSAGASAHPLAVQLTGLIFLMFGDSDYTARLLPLLAGVGVFAILFWLRNWIGNVPALAVAGVWALSPVMTMSSSRLDGGGLLILSSVLILALVFAMGVEERSSKPIALGFVLAIAVTSHPLGWLIAPFTLIPLLVLVRDPRTGMRLVYIAIAFLAGLIAITSWFMTRPSGIVQFFEESFGVLWSDHLSAAGSDWPLTIIVMIADEPLAVLFAIVGLIFIFVRPGWNFTVHPAIVISAVAWAVPMLTLGLLLDGKGPALYGATLIPLVLVGGLGLSIVIEGLLAIRSERTTSALWALAAFGLIVATLRFLELLARGPGEDSSNWVLSALTLGLLIILPLLYVVYRLTLRTGYLVLPVSLGLIALILAVVSLRSALLLPMSSIDRPGEILLAGSSSPAVTQIEQRIKRYSRDATTYMQDARDPTGGHGLTIAMDPNTRDPFAWYFRAFPHSVTVDDVTDLPVDPPSDVIIVSEENRDAFLENSRNYADRSYPVRYELPEALRGAGYGDLLVSLLNPLEYRNLFNFIVYRNTSTEVGHETVTIMIHEDHAGPFWGPLPE